MTILTKNIQSKILFRTEILRDDQNFTEKKYTYQMNYEDPYKTVIPFWPIQLEYHVKNDTRNSEIKKESEFMLSFAKGSNEELDLSVNSNSTLQYDNVIEVPNSASENMINVNQERADVVFQELEGVISTILFRFLLSQ
jgi:hypothetical protein